MAAVRHLGFVTRVFGPPTKIFGCFFHCANVVGIDPLVSIILKFILRFWPENAYLRPQNGF